MANISDMWVCARCHDTFTGDKHWVMGGYCEACSKAIDEKPTQFNTENWRRYLIKIRDREWTDTQLKCSQHHYERVPKSGALLGISLYRCIYCEAVTQST